MNEEEIKQFELCKFEKDKIITLNKFFMKHIFVSIIINILIFLVSVLLLIVLLWLSNIDHGLTITIISMIATFVLTTSKSMIDKTTGHIQYLVHLLSEEQRGLNKTIGVEIDKVEFNEQESSKMDS